MFAILVSMQSVRLYISSNIKLMGRPVFIQAVHWCTSKYEQPSMTTQLSTCDSCSSPLKVSQVAMDNWWVLHKIEIAAIGDVCAG